MYYIIFALTLLLASESFAFSPARPKKHDLFSENGKYVVDVDPEAKLFTVFAANNRGRPLWSFSRPVQFGSHFLSNDGNSIAIVHWRFVGVDFLDEGVCVEFWNETGKFVEYRFNKICPYPRQFWINVWLVDGPVGEDWRTWYTELELNGDTLRVRTTDEFEYSFSMLDGRIVDAKRISWPWFTCWVLPLFGGFAIRRRILRRRLESQHQSRNRAPTSPNY